MEILLRPIPKRFSEVIDRLPPDSWVALTPDRKLVAGIGATQEEAAQNAKSDYGLQNPTLMRVPEPPKGGACSAINQCWRNRNGD